MDDGSATRPAVRDPLAGVDINDRLARQLAFVVEIDRVKQVLRQSPITDGSRRENDAEHQWHLAVMALLLAEHAAAPVDVSRVVAMVLVHDLVEIDAGDAYFYDTAARAAAVAKEAAAADRVFGMLPPDQEAWIRGVWEEFEAGATAEARFARALDRLQPILVNAASGGIGWRDRQLPADQVTRVARTVTPGAPALGHAVEAVVERARADGLFGR